MISQSLIPVLKSIRDCEQAQDYTCRHVILMDVHLSQLEHCCQLLQKQDKKILIHLDLIKGLNNDEYAVEYVVNDLFVDGIITIKSSIIEKVKKLKKIAIQRIFMIDSQSYIKSINLIKKSNPDYIELLPGCLFKMIERVKKSLPIKVIAGGLIETQEELNEAINKGATAITTTNKELIRQYCTK